LKFKELRAELQNLSASCPHLSDAPVMAEAPSPRPTWILIRGDFRTHGTEVQPATPAFLPRMPAEPHPSRLTLARWLVARNNPLTARVAVNRMWQAFFGRGLVSTSEDFGKQGERPTHPELLDWLAAEFMDRGWDVKQMHKLIVQSATYRQVSSTRKELQERDPYNLLLARQARLRLEAELLRDASLEASGLLNPEIGGPSVYPQEPAGVTSLGYGDFVKWPESKGNQRYRRGLYTFFQRAVPYPMLMNFDAPNSELSCTRRIRSTTPLQALNLLNDPVFFEAAQALAARILRDKQGGLRDRIRYGFELCLARDPSPGELERASAYFEKRQEMLKRDSESAVRMFPGKLEGMDPAETGAWVGVSRALLNLDEFMTRE
jgi:hypothetical protein